MEEKEYEDVHISGYLIQIFYGHVGKALLATKLNEWYLWCKKNRHTGASDTVVFPWSSFAAHLPYSIPTMKKWVKELERLEWVSFIRHDEKLRWCFMSWDGPDLVVVDSECSTKPKEEKPVQTPTLAVFDPRTCRYEMYERN